MIVTKIRPDAYLYHSHIEVHNYNKGDYPEIENALQIWNKAYFRRENIGMEVDRETNILYLPRSLQPYLLKNFNIVNIDIARIGHKFTADVLIPPRDDFQVNSINFLLGREPFYDSAKSSQIVLTAPPGSGKTYCGIVAAIEYGLRTIIICHRKKILSQWESAIKNISNLTDNNILNLDSKYINRLMNKNITISEDINFILCSHQTFTNFSSKYGWNRLQELINKLNIGIKIVDEAHRFFRNIFLIDAYTNIRKNIYLTATFDRSDYIENRIFHNAFSTAPRYGKFRIQETRKHIILISVLYDSNPTEVEKASMINRGGYFDRNEYIRYQIKKGYIEKAIIGLMNRLFIKLDGRILLLSPMIESTKYFADVMKNNYPNKSVAIYNSEVSVVDKEDAMENADIISSTSSSLGEGTNMKDLRFLFMIESYSSKVNSYQNPSRLREYAPDKDCYYIEFIDEGFDRIVKWSSKRKKEFSKYFKKFVKVRIEDI